MWVVGELDDDNIPYDRFSVSSIPEIWLFVKKNKLFCHWPMWNAGPKIKSQQIPKSGSSDWTTYPCRLLMKGGNLIIHLNIRVEGTLVGYVGTLSLVKLVVP